MPSYLTTHDVELMHHVLIEQYGGSLGIRDYGLLEAAIYRPQSGYYGDIYLQAAAFFESLITNHPFVDGNKRIAFAATDVFLRINGYRFITNSSQAYSKIMDMFDKKQMAIEHIHHWFTKIIQKI
jgi:death-on-curing protein